MSLWKRFQQVSISLPQSSTSRKMPWGRPPMRFVCLRRQRALSTGRLHTKAMRYNRMADNVCPGRGGRPPSGRRTDEWLDVSRAAQVGAALSALSERCLSRILLLHPLHSHRPWRSCREWAFSRDLSGRSCVGPRRPSHSRALGHALSR